MVCTRTGARPTDSNCLVRYAARSTEYRLSNPHCFVLGIRYYLLHYHLLGASVPHRRVSAEFFSPPSPSPRSRRQIASRDEQLHKHLASLHRADRDTLEPWVEQDGAQGVKAPRKESDRNGNRVFAVTHTLLDQSGCILWARWHGLQLAPAQLPCFQ